jgi:hypothetical protein
MVLSMPSPFKHPKTGVYWFRQRTPKDVLPKAKGQKCSVEVNGTIHHLTIGGELKVSLGTKDVREAKARAKDVQTQFDIIWGQFRVDALSLSHKQVHALAGEIYRTFMAAIEDNPGSPEIWQHVRKSNNEALTGRTQVNPLAIGKVYLEPQKPSASGRPSSAGRHRHLGEAFKGGLPGGRKPEALP